MKDLQGEILSPSCEVGRGRIHGFRSVKEVVRITEALEGFLGVRDIGQTIKGIRDIFL